MITKESLLEKLPHGSGIDCKWNIEDKGQYFKCQNSYHCMNENGYYDGWADFTVIIPKKAIGDFKLHFNGQQAQYKNKRYQLRDFLEDTLYSALYSYIIPQAQHELCQAEYTRLGGAEL